MITSIVAALAMTADGVAEGLYALRHRFRPRAASFGYAIGALVAGLYGAVTPVTFTVETITVATRTVTSRPQIYYVVALSSAPLIVLGATGLYSTLIDYIETAVIGGIICGVGIILTSVGVDYVRERPWTAGTSTLSAFVLYLATGDLVLVIIVAVVVGTAVHHFMPAPWKIGEEDRNLRESSGEDGGQEDDDFVLEEEASFSVKDWFHVIPIDWKAAFSRPVLLGALALLALQLGAVVSYDEVNSEIAGSDTHLDGVMLMTGLASFVSAVFGGPPLATTPAPMADAPSPVFSTWLFMAAMALITAFGLVRRVGEFIPLESIAGFLVVLGIPVILPENLPIALERPIPGGTALAITALTNPFYGILAGQAVAIALDAGLDMGVDEQAFAGVTWLHDALTMLVG